MKIAIAGFGTEGVASYQYWAADKSNDITIVDAAETPGVPLPKDVKTILGPGAFEKLDGFDLVIRTAGLPPRLLKTDGKVWSATNEFFDKCPAPIIGVTGSKGKGTTSSLIASILRAAGRKVWLVGNIGVPALSDLAKIQSSDIVVFELSSFQLWDVVASPHVAVVLYIEQEHLDKHGSMEDYVAAKANITAFQTPDDLLIYNRDNQYSAGIAAGTAARTLGYPGEETAHILDGSFYYAEQKICSVDVLQIRGLHNQQNALAAIDAAWRYTNDISAIEKGLADFKGLPHRLEFVATKNGVDYYDDSIATTPSSAIAALNAFDKPAVIIVGGSYKGSDFSELARVLKERNAEAIFIGAESTALTEAAHQAGYAKFEVMQQYEMEDVVKRAAVKAQEGSVVLLSPAAASFDHFKNYADRGDQFKRAVENL